MIRASFVSALAIAALASSALAQSADIGPRANLSVTEAGLWGESDRAENSARRSGERVQSPELEAYLREVTCRLAAERCNDIRIYVMQRPFVNATMAPNGYMEVWSGLLLRAEDEAQLSFVLGHEIAHYTERHSLASIENARTTGNVALLLTFGLAVAGTAAAVNNPTSAQSIMDATGNLVDIVYLSSVASLFRFSRENETEADAIGHQHAVAAQYDPHAGAKLWGNLSAEHQQSDFPRRRAREARSSVFNTHPITTERIAALNALAVNQPAANLERARYRAAIRPHLGAWLRDELRRRDYGETLFLVARLEQGGEDAGVLSYYRGEAYRLRRGEGDLALARQAYEAAIAQPDAPAAAWRQLGEIYEREQRPAEAAALLQTYLTRAPDAPDRALIERRLQSLGSGL